MKTKNVVYAAVLLALGTVLHTVVPGLVGGVKPDFLLATMFLAIIVCDDKKMTAGIAIAAGILAAMTTSFPGGQIPSLIDKIVTSYAYFFLYRALLKNRVGVILTGMSMGIATVISGAIFLGSALLVAGLPMGFGALFVAVVLPTAVCNIFFGMLLTKLYATFVRQQAVVTRG